MPEAIANQYFIRNFVTVKRPENDTGLEIILDGQGFYFSIAQTFSILFKKINRDVSTSYQLCVYRFSSLKPNITHEILKHLEDIGKVGYIVTQNVDNLHLKAGNKKVIELHGTAFRVTCLNCDHKICRHELQRVFQTLNPSMIATTQMIRPDGDVELSQVHDSHVYMYIFAMF